MFFRSPLPCPVRGRIWQGGGGFAVFAEKAASGEREGVVEWESQIRFDVKDIFQNFRFAADGNTSLADALCSHIKEEIAFGRL